MTRVVVDSRGRLVGFRAVPAASREARATTPVESPDWDPVLREAGFDPARLESVTPQWTIGVDSDRRAAWLGTLEGQPAPRFHVEAASYQGRLVSFELRGLWADPAPEPPRGQLVSRFDLDEAEAKRVATASLVSLSWAVYFAAAIRAWRSLRLGRGDRRGAMKAALLTFVAVTLADLVRADHASDPVVETSLLFQILSQGMFGAASVWLVYMALEPAVRRRWPEVLISWNRLLDRRFRDPMCGRDALIGIVAGAGMNLARMLEGKRSSPLSVLAAPHHVLYYLLIAIPEALLYGIAGLFLLYLLRLITRNALLSQFALFVVFLIPSLVASGWTPVSVLNALVVSQVMSRFGLVATSAMWFAFAALSNAPLTLDPSSWYAGRSFGVLGLFVVLVTLAAWTSLGGKPIFAAVLLDDD
jgi:serine/threonine-protein kinase